MLHSLKIQHHGVERIKRNEEKKDVGEQSIQMKFQIMGQGINSDGKECRRDVKESLKLVKGEEKRERDLMGIVSFREKGREILQREKRIHTKQLWLVSELAHESIHEQENKMNFHRLRRHKVLFWLLPLLFLSFYPKPASSQVRVFF